jgi:hypothetical protein
MNTPSVARFGVLELFVVLVVVAIAVFMYFLPTLLAAKRNKANTLAIGLVNLFLGWTIAGWIGTLVWAASTQMVDTNVERRRSATNVYVGLYAAALVFVLISVFLSPWTTPSRRSQARARQPRHSVAHSNP